MPRQGLRKLIVAGMVISGVAAAILMFRRGESLFGIARKTITNPVGSLINEVQTAASDRSAATPQITAS
jgi:hypothetical protein